MIRKRFATRFGKRSAAVSFCESGSDSEMFEDSNSSSDISHSSSSLNNGNEIINAAKSRRVTLSDLDGILELDDNCNYLHGIHLNTLIGKEKNAATSKPVIEMQEDFDSELDEESNNGLSFSFEHSIGSIPSPGAADAADEFIGLETSTKAQTRSTPSPPQGRPAKNILTVQQLYETQSTNILHHFHKSYSGIQMTFAKKVEKDFSDLREEIQRQKRELASQRRIIAALLVQEDAAGRGGRLKLKITKAIKDDVHSAHRSLDNKYKGTAADGHKLYFRSTYNDDVTTCIKRIVRERQPNLDDRLLHLACQRRFESFTRASAEVNKPEIKNQRKMIARRRALFERRKKALKDGESFDDVPIDCMSDEEDVDEDGVKVFVRHTPLWRAQSLTTLILAVDGRLERRGAPTFSRKYGPPTTRTPPPNIPEKYLKMAG